MTVIICFGSILPKARAQEVPAANSSSVVGVASEEEFLAAMAQPPSTSSGTQSNEQPAMPDAPMPQDAALEEWIQSQGGFQSSDPSQAGAPALEMLEQQKKSEKPAANGAADNEELHEYADPSLRAQEKKIEASIPDSHERGSRKEKRFFKEHQLKLEIDKLPKRELLLAPIPEKPQPQPGIKP
ncbi:MAG: hypothetical protein HY547_01535 [Elusimicrobia bacterium]|nr:hypothetical protein [Elusimicrobiota bacterium]